LEDISYNVIYGRQKRKEGEMSPRTGRPTDNPKSGKITVRLDDESMRIMKEYCDQKSVERAEAVRRGIKKLDSEIKR
jgi:hypothetical protein